MLPDLALPESLARLGLMAWPLLACSVVALAFCLERSVFFSANYWRKKTEFTRLSTQLEAYKLQPKSLRDEAMSLLLVQLRSRYYSGLKTLRIIAALSPMIGLLGTILGIIAAFKVIALHAGPVSPNMIADGLGEAMLTTAAGLLIALPSLLLAHVFQSLSDQQLDDFSLRLNRMSLAFAVEAVEKSAGDTGAGSNNAGVHAPDHGALARQPENQALKSNQTEALILNGLKLLS